MISFNLDKEFVSKYSNIKPPFGFNGLGEITFYRTYSRIKKDGTQESWIDVCERVINGMYSIQKDHCLSHKRRWNEEKAQASAQEAFDRMFYLKWTPSGRGLWSVGTPLLHERKISEATLNCAFITTKDIADKKGDIFQWFMSMMMLGVGVGADVKGADKVLVIGQNLSYNTRHYHIEDTREAWCESIKLLIDSYLNNESVIIFHYDLIRKKGEPIKGFGGIASGPEPLMMLHKRLVEILDNRTGEKLTSRDIADIFNLIGTCVVAGNVRRCLPKNSMIHTDNGLIPIQDINIGMNVLTSNGYHKITNKFEQGIQNTIIIKTQDGFFECTPNHRMAVLNGINTYKWIKAEQLSPGDRLITTRKSIDGIKQSMPEFTYIRSKKSTTCQDIIIPELDNDMAWLIGLFCADGYTYANRKDNGFNAYVSMVFSENEYEIAEKAKQQLERFGTRVTLEHRKNENSWSVRSTSKQLAWYFDENIKQPNTSIVIPKWIYTATPDIRISFVCGIMDGDGAVNNRPCMVVSTIYKDFALGIQNILYSCGIESRLKESGEWESKNGWQKQYYVSLINNNAKIKFINKGNLLKTIPIRSKSSYSNTIPLQWINGKNSDDCMPVDIFENKYNEQLSYTPVEVLSIENGRLIETYDIEVDTMHEFFCNGYLTHNSAELLLANESDEEFGDLKNYEKFPERSEFGWTSNNSYIITKPKQSYNEYIDKIMNNGEPGFFFEYNAKKYSRMGKEKYDNGIGANPCQPGFATILTPNGIKTFDEINIGDIIWSGKQWTKIINKMYTGEKQVYIYNTNAGRFIGTENHRVVSNGEKIEVAYAESIDIAKGNTKEAYINHQDVMDGLVIGDGTVHKASNNLVLLCIDKKDYDYFNYSIIKDYILKNRNTLGDNMYEIRTTITYDELPRTWERTIPNRFYKGDDNTKVGFLRGLFSANGCVNGYGRRIELKQTSYILIRQVQEMLSSLGIQSYITTTEPAKVEHNNGIYVSRKSYAINITSDRYQFLKLIGFIQDYKNYAIKGETSREKKSFEITSKEYLGIMPVYDITVDCKEHVYWTGGLLVSNCVEQILANKEMCLLTEIYLNNHDDLYDFLRTLKFAYLYAKTISLTYEWIDDKESRDIMCKNRRIGLSVTGIAQFISKFGLSELKKFLNQGYDKVTNYDVQYSLWLGINESIRTTSVKPSGCQTGDTLIPTENGIFKLHELQKSNNQWDNHDINIYQKDSIENSTKFYNNGYAKTKKIITNNGTSLESTPNHMYQILRNNNLEWVAAENIKIGDILPFRLGYYNKIVEPDFIYPKNRRACNSKTITYPSSMNSDLAWLIGLYYGDGSNHNKGIRIAGDFSKIEILENAERILKEQFNIDSIIYTRTKGNNVDLYANSVELLLFLDTNNLLKQKAAYIEIPKIIRMSSRTSILSFINGYASADGCYKTNELSFVTISEKWAKEFVTILRMVGYNAKVREFYSKTSMGKNKQYWISIRKGSTADERYIRKETRNIRNQLKTIGLKDFDYDIAVSIEDGYAETFDIEVPVNNMYLANNYISHNTVSLLAGATPGVHYPISRYYIRRIRVSKDSPMIYALNAAGYYIEEDVYDTSKNTYVVEIPIDCGEGIRDQHEVGLFEQFELTSFMQENWSDNSVSVTVTFDPKLTLASEINSALTYYQYKLKSISLLPLYENGTYAQMPYERITKEEYEKTMQNIKPLNMTYLNDADFMRDAYCDGIACEIKAK